ncbi:hypothetical protein Tco_1026524 [Tanacetum coccineum]
MSAATSAATWQPLTRPDPAVDPAKPLFRRWSNGGPTVVRLLGTRWQVWMAALEAQLVARTPEPTMNHLEAHVASSDMWIRNNTVVGSRANDWRYH